MPGITLVRSDTPALRVAGRQPAPRSGRPVTEVVTYRAKSSSVAWTSLAPFSRSGQATSNASYRPRRTPSRLTCSQAHPTEVAAALVPLGRLPPGQGLRRGRPRPAGDRWAQARSTSADPAACRCGAGWSSVRAVGVAEWRKCDSDLGPGAPAMPNRPDGPSSPIRGDCSTKADRALFLSRLPVGQPVFSEPRRGRPGWAGAGSLSHTASGFDIWDLVS
jgi:hypothetical protein